MHLQSFIFNNKTFSLSLLQISALKAEKRQRDQQRKAKITENRKHLSNVRVVQKNLVFVVGLPPRLADPEVRYLHPNFFFKFTEKQNK